MKNMFENKSYEYTRDAVLEAVDAFANTMLMQQIAADKGKIAIGDPLGTAKQFSIIDDGIERLSSKARANSFKDIITRTFGLFDSDMTELNAKRSDLLAKDHVKNYTYKHHIWRAGWYSVEYDNIFFLINQVLNVTRNVVDKNTRDCSAQYIKERADEYYKAKVDGYIETRLCGWKKGAYANFLRINMLGDGKKEVVREFNFQDDWSITDMLNWEQKITKDLLDHGKKIDEANIKDIRSQLKEIIKRFHDYASTDKENAKIYAAEIKRCIKYTTLLVSKLDEFIEETYSCMQVQRGEIHKVLNGLLEYHGD